MDLGASQYISVTTYRRDGTPVATPVWCAQDGDAVVFWTVTGSGKVKRIRNNPEVTLAPCDLRGNLLGDAVKGRAEILSAEETARARGLLRRKYGFIGWVTLLGSRLRRGADGTIGVRVTDI
ncbi:PPOX class F420-dependent oxidoreductase [Nonomuraea sp. NBC_01738]|uniref:PPOX class F420-dependent oxidoreductase n=1 Tax=Nonomuraea sp. NBC_01738 TaxID=2976003 RepID=UPI002E0E2939|nr:PPOX class F420-dependent oxidoreductase [Nonomuraea sp. NBC_01738]